MVIDIHIHHGEDKDGRVATLSHIKSEFEKSGIKKGALFPFNCDNLVEESIKILEHSKTHPYVIPFLRFNPKTITKEKLHETIALGFKGIKLHPRSQNFNPNDEQFDWIFNELEKYNIPILIHSRIRDCEPQSHPRHIVERAKKHPNLIFIMGHFMGGDGEVTKDILHLPNMYIETSIYSVHSFIEDVIKQGFDRILYGSDYPYSMPHIEIAKIEHADISQEMKEKILYKNAMKILNLNE